MAEKKIGDAPAAKQHLLLKFISQINKSLSFSISQKKKNNSSKLLKSNSLVKEKFVSASNNWMEKNRSLVLRQTPLWARSLIVMLLSLGSITILGGIFIRIDEVITVSGQLKSIGGTVEVKTPAGGKIQKVFFVDGQVIKKGDLLIRFDTREASKLKSTLLNLIKSEEDSLSNNLETINSQKLSLAKQASVLKQRLKTKEIVIDNMEILVSQGGFQKMSYLQELDAKYELESQISQLAERNNQLDLRALEIKNTSKKSLNQYNNELLKANVRLQYQNVTAPISGVIFDPQVRENGVLSSGERIVSIVPQVGLYGEVYVPNSEIGYIQKGLPTRVRVDAYPFTTYGELIASVSQIGADALEPDQISNYYRFPVKLNLDSQYLASKDYKVPLKPGMAISANLKLRDKRLISILSDLLVDQSDSVRNIKQQ